MAGDWIKMRPSLLTNPKVNGIARQLEVCRKVGGVLSTGFSGEMSEIVTRSVMRHVTVSSLLVVWGAANEHTKDGVFHGADLSDLDDMTGIPGFGEAMSAVGWAVYDEENNSVTLPNFCEYNTSGSARSATAKSNAERQKEYRARKKSEVESVTNPVATDNVTNNVTSNRREEKSREEERTRALPVETKVSTSSPPLADDRFGDDAESKAATKAAKREQAQQRLCQITDEASAAYNAICAKPHGLMQLATKPGRETRQANVRRILATASAICDEQYGDKRITRQFWDDYFGAVQADEHKSGRLGGGRGHENWVPDFEYLTRKDTMVDVFEKTVTEAQA